MIKGEDKESFMRGLTGKTKSHTCQVCRHSPINQSLGSRISTTEHHVRVFLVNCCRNSVLGEYIRDHLRRFNPNNSNNLCRNEVTDKVVANVNVLSRLEGCHFVGCKGVGSRIVFKHRSRAFHRFSECNHQLTKESNLVCRC